MTETICHTCNTKTIRTENFVDIQLPAIHNKSVSELLHVI